MSSASCYRNRIKELKEVKVRTESFKKFTWCPIINLEFGPFIECFLSICENCIDGFLYIHFLIDYICMSLVGECNLIFEISKSIIYWSCREHQYLCLDSGSHDILEELLVSGYFIFAWRIVSEVMRLIDNHKVIVSPVYTR